LSFDVFLDGKKETTAFLRGSNPVTERTDWGGRFGGCGFEERKKKKKKGDHPKKKTS
jgi:hypothetical protein